MRGLRLFQVVIIAGVSASGCAIPDSERCRDGFEFRDNYCYEEQDTSSGDSDTGDTGGGSDVDTEWSTDDAASAGIGLGKSCSCEGEDCEMMGVPLPAGSPIIGCSDVSANWPGAVKTCYRSYQGDAADDMYFANGYCGLMASRCEGNDMICSNGGILGDYEKLTVCPPGAVMIISSAAVEMAGVKSTIYSKACVAGCDNDEACRTDEKDSVFGGESTQYQCVELGDAKFCYDPRSLPDNATAEAF